MYVDLQHKYVAMDNSKEEETLQSNDYEEI